MNSIDEQRRPQIKPTVQITVVGESLLFRASSVTIEVSDEQGVLRALLELMDGTREMRAVHAALATRHPEVVWEDFVAAMAALDEHRLLEDAAVQPTGLSAYELQRWHRNINFFGSFCGIEGDKYEFQRKIARAKVTLLGLGGLGSHLLFDLAAMGIQDVLAVDFDQVELSNLNRQILYGDADVGRLKAEAAAERIRVFSPRMRFTAWPKRIASVHDVLTAIEGRDVVLCVADRPKMEILDWVNEACVRAGVPLVTGGLDTQKARYYSMIPGQSGCLVCWREALKTSDPYSDQVLTEHRRTQLRGDNAAFVPFVSLVTGFMMAETAKIIAGPTSPSACGRVWEVDFSDMETKLSESWQRLPDCPVCGGDPRGASSDVGDAV
ncbi:HesA/MoeB/ThiF family protein [Polyangium aurulentum]|uniref:HesA/MoeB/ThiF family protein n=1 Tax=Polyangium aurulentum TaxID=2567896 RepID=UPI0010ADB15A|nr:ThiF family adenylyltransferase [Polyangium aurulentum]UQA60521.1 ThiF family adenylyltransferase [Polyangium aurulentum]